MLNFGRGIYIYIYIYSFQHIYIYIRVYIYLNTYIHTPGHKQRSLWRAFWSFSVVDKGSKTHGVQKGKGHCGFLHQPLGTQFLYPESISIIRIHFFKIFPKQTVTHPFLPNSYTQQVTQYRTDLLVFTDPIHSKVKIFDPPKLHKFKVYLPGLLCLNKTYRTNLIWMLYM